MYSSSKNSSSQKKKEQKPARRKQAHDLSSEGSKRLQSSHSSELQKPGSPRSPYRAAGQLRSSVLARGLTELFFPSARSVLSQSTCNDRGQIVRKHLRSHQQRHRDGGCRHHKRDHPPLW